jgi:hypothetical protein
MRVAQRQFGNLNNAAYMPLSIKKALNWSQVLKTVSMGLRRRAANFSS